MIDTLERHLARYEQTTTKEVPLFRRKQPLHSKKLMSGLMYWSPEQMAETLTLPYLLLTVYFVTCALSIANYVAYFRFENDTYGSDVPRAYIAFVVIGTIAYVLFSGVMWLWAAKYSETASIRGRRLSHGVWAIFVFKDLPLFIIEYHAVLCCGGFRNSFQGFVFVVQFICALCSFSYTWLSFIWRTASFCQFYFGGGLVEEGLKTGTEKVNIFSVAPVDQHNRQLDGMGPSPFAFQRPYDSNPTAPPPTLQSMHDYSPPNSPSSHWGGSVHPPTPQPMNSAAEAFARDYDIPTPNRNSSSGTRNVGPRTLTRGDSLPPRRLPLSRSWDENGGSSPRRDASYYAPPDDEDLGPYSPQQQQRQLHPPHASHHYHVQRPSYTDPSPNWRWQQQPYTPRDGSAYGGGSPTMTVERTVI